MLYEESSLLARDHSLNSLTTTIFGFFLPSLSAQDSPHYLKDIAIYFLITNIQMQSKLHLLLSSIFNSWACLEFSSL